MDFLTLDEVKLYLKIDHDDEDALLTELIKTAKTLVEDVLRAKMPEPPTTIMKDAGKYAVAYIYENREKANHRELTINISALLFAHRKEAF